MALVWTGLFGVQSGTQESKSDKDRSMRAYLSVGQEKMRAPSQVLKGPTILRREGPRGPSRQRAYSEDEFNEIKGRMCLPLSRDVNRHSDEL